MEEDIITYSDKLIKAMNKTSIRVDNFHNSLLVSTNPNLHVFKIPLDDLFIKYRNHLLLTITQFLLSKIKNYYINNIKKLFHFYILMNK